jgi:uncharacterized protein (TIGR00251 family)
MIDDHINRGQIRIIAKPNSPKTEIIRWDQDKKALRMNVNAAPEKGRANKEIIRFFSKQYQKKVRIKSGFDSKEKVLQIY